MKGKASFTGYKEKDVRNAKKAAAGRKNLQAHRRDWNVRAIKTMPANMFEVFLCDGDIPYASIWLPEKAHHDVLSPSQIPSYASEAEAMAAYEQAGKPTALHLDPVNLPAYLLNQTYLHLMRLAPGVMYAQPIQPEQQLGESRDGGSVSGIPEHAAGSGGGLAAASQPQPEQLVSGKIDASAV